MPRTCTICNHESREAIDEKLLSGEAYRSIAKHYAISPAALFRHKDHLPAAMVKAVDAAETVQAGNLLDRLRDLNRETAAILREARTKGEENNELALKAIARVEKQLELEGRLLGELSEHAVLNVVISPEWQRGRSVILVALAPFPAARLASAEALQNAGA